MLTPIESAVDRARRYAKSKKMTILEDFGGGFDGYVVATNKLTAIKAFNFEKLYRQELEIYEYLKRWQIAEVGGFNIPRLIGCDDTLAVIEMTVVTPPYILDFVTARIEVEIEYDEEWIARRKEEFEDDWPTVKKLMSDLRAQGIWLYDVHPRNICFR